MQVTINQDTIDSIRSRINENYEDNSKLTTFDAIVIFLAIFIMFIAFFMSTAFISSSLFAGIGIVAGIAIVVHKFKYVRQLIIKMDKWFDLSVLIIGFLLAGSAQSMASAAFASILISAYLVLARMVYKDELNDFKLLPFNIKSLFKRKDKTNEREDGRKETQGDNNGESNIVLSGYTVL